MWCIKHDLPAYNSVQSRLMCKKYPVMAFVSWSSLTLPRYACFLCRHLFASCYFHPGTLKGTTKQSTLAIRKYRCSSLLRGWDERGAFPTLSKRCSRYCATEKRSNEPNGNGVHDFSSSRQNALSVSHFVQSTECQARISGIFYWTKMHPTDNKSKSVQSLFSRRCP